MSKTLSQRHIDARLNTIVWEEGDTANGSAAGEPERSVRMADQDRPLGSEVDLIAATKVGQQHTDAGAAVLEASEYVIEGPMAASAKMKKTDPQHYPHTPEDLRKEPNYPIWVLLRGGDRGARDDLVVRYAPLVKYVIGRMAITLPAAMDSDDVLSAGTIGLLHAIERFDPDQGVRFETYALQRIRGAIIDTIRSLSPLSRGAGRRARILEETTAALAQVLGRAPLRDELARELGVDLCELGRMMLESAHVIVSLDNTGPGGDDDGDAQPLRDVLHDPDEASTDAVVEENELVDRLTSSIDALPPRDRLVLNLYYHEELTLKQISRVIEVSESRVSQIHTAAVVKLRTLLRTTQLAWAS